MQGESARAAAPRRGISSAVLSMEFLTRYGMLVAWLGVIVVFGILKSDLFLTRGNFETIFGTQSVLLVLALGLTVPLIAGEFDLSIAGAMGLALVVVGELNVNLGWNVWLAALAGVAAATLVGCVNAFLVVVVGIDSIVATLGAGTILVGLQLGINPTTTSGIDPDFVGFITDPLFGVAHAFYYGLALTLVFTYVLRFTPLGRYLYFVGAGREVARLAGLRVDRIRGASLVASGLISGLAGILLAGTLSASDPNVSASYLLPAFAAVFLGATSITPGRFNEWGCFIAVYFLITGITGLELLGIAGWIEQVYYGASLILAVSLSSLAARRRTRAPA
jgi:ribose transport system permease protein